MFSLAFNIVRPFLSKEAAEMIMFHPDYDSLHQHVDKAALPEEFGGTAGTFDNSACADAIEQMGDLLDQFTSIKVEKKNS